MAEPQAADAPAHAEPAGPALEIDDDTQSVADSLASDTSESLTASLSSSVLNYPIEHGRRFHAYRHGAYVMPNDDRELDRLDMTHLMNVKAVGNKLFLAPLEEEKVQKILDIGTGTGIWAIEMGELYPGAEVLGNDLSPVQPAWVPPNVKFEVDDVESEWTHSDKFDFIFCRYMSAGIWKWPELVKNVFGGLSTGGWAEFQDYDMRYYSEDGSLTKEHHTKKWIDTLLASAAKVGREPVPGVKLKEWVTDAGFVNVREEVFRMPIGPWAKDRDMKQVGQINLVQILEGLEAFSLRLLCDVEGWSETEVTVLLANVRNELKSGAFHAQIKIHVVYGQRP
ncbi:S-adenosyl-L-methionine-dependent methyltransferase [Plectosphaerella plurivora]|uniref:S-adenosyl-L-methionine-dependent methyltransferase n=1 Tax=Plectosphaerella plurivora TaxID=936078 RepID=A0A9P8VEF4_9PEZI|nr:S-adenosyl-L-methionine-dependent methyltransferase [Plectosphaerella plurivora]